jgi:hypothetical protein
MTNVLKLQSQSDQGLGDDAPYSSHSYDHCVDAEVL